MAVPIRGTIQCVRPDVKAKMNAPTGRQTVIGQRMADVKSQGLATHESPASPSTVSLPLLSSGLCRFEHPTAREKLQ